VKFVTYKRSEWPKSFIRITLRLSVFAFCTLFVFNPHVNRNNLKCFVCEVYKCVCITSHLLLKYFDMKYCLIWYDSGLLNLLYRLMQIAGVQNLLSSRLLSRNV
jgi:hypothetical protein